MSKQTITQAQAYAILSDDDAVNFPHRIINESGQAAVAQFINASAADPSAHDLEAWYTEAESVANDAEQGESIVIEINGARSISGNPITLDMDDSHFDWILNG